MARRPAGQLNRANPPASPRAPSSLVGGLFTVARVVAAVLAYLLAFVGSSILLYALVARLPASIEGEASVAALGVAEAVALCAVLVVWHTLDGRPLAELGLRRRGALGQWLRGAAVGSVMMLLVVTVGYTLVDGAVWGANPDPFRALIVLVAGFVGFAIQGPAEELLFRGYVLENVKDQWGVPVAVGISSVLFAAFHVFNPGFGLLPLLNLLLFGLGTALYKVRMDGGQLWGVFAIHSLWNWLQQVVFGLPNSGNVSSPENALFTVTPAIDLPDPLSGGGFGPEGTLAASVVLLGLIVVCLRARPRSEPAPVAGRRGTPGVRKSARS